MSSSGFEESTLGAGCSMEPFLELGRGVEDIDTSFEYS
jgi:hypothetical protein